MSDGVALPPQLGVAPRRVGYQVHELFWSIQGEGVQAGQTAIFVRLQGCPIGCEWCDAKLTWFAGGAFLSLDDLAAAISAMPVSRWFVITGGEPLLYDLDPLIGLLRQLRDRTKIQIETAGWYPFKGALRPDWTTVSPKYRRDYKVAMNVSESCNELKYVVDDHFTPDVVGRYVRSIVALGRKGVPLIGLMPEGSPPKPANTQRVLDLLRRFPQWRFSPRLQYDYAAIGGLEGDTNQIISVAEAKQAAAAHHAPVRAVEEGRAL